ncbi:DeoR/GlpR family DNA-binding transcription regulator [Acinetobacter sp. MD2(2019)]|uniref:DeoR/GlpR family DNA-binding transcription regulator n=1 Tax=Acinetobacter sp. MD2(2019) TaxID=2605273 RepID=UPI002D1F4B13|nr:DeoR/GlpR family DNA-binding transcription regulator [Acinetobacter sp. MD2(2019)]MEB3753373.1 DeoR/GlpR transcriptional regulator [Acinetobacter sp. MD2(2019)]
MLQQERLHRIQALLKKLQRLSTERVMNELEISRETARRDMIELEALGVAKRVHGGLVATESIAVEAPLHIRNTQFAKEKRAIARAAIQHLQSGQTIFLDAGSTTSILAEELRTLSGLTILTNSLQAVFNLTMASDAEQMNHEIILLGGRVQQRAQTQGELLIQEIYRYQADIALLSPVGIHPAYGASSFYTEEAHIAQAMLKQSQQTIILADQSKLDVISRVNYAKPSEISALISNKDDKSEIDCSAYQKAFAHVEWV